MNEPWAPAVELAPGVCVGGPPGVGPLPVIAGPCALESEEVALGIARWLAQIAPRLGLAPVFKASFDKANRSSLDSYRGPGLAQGLALLRRVGEESGLPLLTDIHEPHQAALAADVCDVLQIPAFLCRQTDLVVAAAQTGRAVNIKKGQFLAPDDLLKIVDKARAQGNSRITVTERGFSFGYHNLVVDMRSFAMMHRDGIPVIYDLTHSLQLPGGGKETGGAREYAEPLARAALAAGADGLFLEVHPNPAQALSDSTTQLAPPRAESLLAQLTRLHQALAP